MEELAKFREIRARRAGKPAVPGSITVDAQGMKNMQGAVPFELWTAIRMKAVQVNMSSKGLLRHALETYLAMIPEDFQRIKERYEEALKEEEGKEQ